MIKKLIILTLTTATAVLTASAQTNKAYQGHTIAKEGAWCWFADPRALHYENKKNKINSTYFGYIDCHGNIKATQIDHRKKTRQEVLVRSWFQPDDHDNPAFLVLPDERIMIIYSRHTDEACFYYRISRNPGDITDLGEEKRLATANNTTYPNPFILSDDPNHIYMCWRGIGWHPTVAQMSMPDANDNISFTWGPYQMVKSTGARPYAKYVSNGKDKIYLAYTTGHPDNEYPNWLYCNVFDINDHCLYDIKGKKLSEVERGAFGVQKTNGYAQAHPYTIVDKTSDRRNWLWNMALDKQGHPIISMTKINKEKTNHDYFYTKWNGEEWLSTFIACGGGQFHQTPKVEMCYSGGMAVDRDNINDVYCSVPINGVYEIVKYTMANDGKAVKSSKQITFNSKKNNARPFVIEGTKKSPLRLTWMNGDYYYWIVNTRYPNAYPTSIMADSKLIPMTDITQNAILDTLLSLSPDNYEGNIITLGHDIVYGINSKQYPYIKIGKETYTGQNVLGTADSWATENKATTDGKWYSKTKLPSFRLTITMDGKHLMVYRDGMVDIKIPYNRTSTETTNPYNHGGKTK